MAPSYRDRDDPDYFVITIFEAIEDIIGEDSLIEERLSSLTTENVEETINSLIKDIEDQSEELPHPLITEEVEEWYNQASSYLGRLPADD